MKSSSEITKFEVSEDGGIKIVARSKITNTTSNNGNDIPVETYAEDAIYFSPKIYTQYMTLRAILYGVRMDSSVVMFREDETHVSITKDGEIEVSITPVTDTGKMALKKLVEQILADIYLASRSITTSAIRRASEKIGIATVVKNISEDNMANIEESMYIEKMKVKIFSTAKEKNIPIEELQRKSIELTGQKSSSKWTAEDVNKMMSFVDKYNAKI